MTFSSAKRSWQRLASSWIFIAFILLTLNGAQPLRAAEWDTFSDTWVATDGLGRALPGFNEVGKPRPNKTVGIFYFLWLGAHGRDLHDISKILAADPKNPPWGPRGAFHFWTEPLFGYYLSTDEAVIRKHVQMLADAGVDVLIFDATNGPTYESSYLAVCRVLAAMRKDGLATQQIAFITHSHGGQVAQKLYDDFYGKKRHAELWFRWQGKPLILADPKELTPELREYFTVRESWAWSQPGGWFGDGKDKWPWLDHHPQKPGWHEHPQKPEQISVCLAQHPTSNIGRSFHQGKQPSPSQVNPDAGLCFTEQWNQALKVDPEFIYITGWNEWVAQRFISETGGQPFLGKPLPPGGTFFVDQYSREFSRDAEPMRGGHGDHYYYQMAANIRRYKGVRSQSSIASQPIQIDGEFQDWLEVQPEYRDTLGDPVHRDDPGWKGGGPYVNQTGRNDLMAAKVSGDERQVFFYVKTREPLASCNESNWMLLFINADGNATNGWLGYDFVVNRALKNQTTSRLEKHQGSGYQWAEAGDVSIAIGEAEIELAIPKAALECREDSFVIDFKWADNLQQTGEWSDFTLNGDAAPNDRYGYRAVFRKGSRKP